MIRELLKRIHLKVPRLDLESQVDVKNYYSLSFVIGAGVFASLAMFALSARHSQSTKVHRMLEAVNSAHGFVAKELQNQKLHFNIIKNLAMESDQPLSDLPLEWLGKRIEETKFTCLYYLVWSDKGQKFIKKNTGIEDPQCAAVSLKGFEGGEQSRDIGLIKLESTTGVHNYFVFSQLIAKISEDEKTYLVGYLPVNSVSIGMNSSPAVQVTFTGLQGTDENIQYRVNKVGKPDVYQYSRPVFLGGRLFEAQYSVHWATASPWMAWAWIILFVGFFLTGIISYLYMQLLIYSSETEKKVKEKTSELEEATRNAIRASAIKSRFLAGVSHDVRTPLNLMLGMADLLKETSLSRQQSEYVTSFVRAGKHLLNLINGVLDVARIETGEMISNPEKMALPDLISNVARIVSADCRRKKLNFSYNIEPNIPRYVIADSTLIQQILINLLYNSMKFTKKGDVELNVAYRPESNGESQFEFTVCDTGEGIPEDDLERIFDAFHKRQGEVNTMGVGLGLSIVKSIVSHLNGEISVQSDLGVGSQFRVTLPLQLAGNEAWLDRYLEHREQLAGRSVFLYCHTEIKQKFIKNSLEYVGCKVFIFRSGEAALSQLQQNASGYDYILIDLVSDTIGGLELLDIAGLDADLLGRVFVLCPLVHRETDIERLNECGIENVVFKPVNMDILIKSLAKGTAESEAAEDQAHMPFKINTPSRSLNIIVAEDDIDNRLLIKNYLKNDQVKIYFAEDGQKALDKFKNAHQDFDLILTDLQMPRMDGFQLTKNIRKFEAEQGLRPVPLIVLTADAQRDQVRKLLELGANEYLTKPISKAKLRMALAQQSGQIH